MALKKQLKDAETELPELPLGRHLANLTRKYYGALTHLLRHLDIDKHFSLLLHVNSNPRCTQQYLAEKLHIDKAALVRILDELAEKDYLKRTVNENDRREHFIRLTEKGKKSIPAIRKAIHELNETATKGLNKQEKRTFHKAISTVCCNLSQLPADKVEVKFRKR